VHGLAEHSGRYAHVGAYLSSQGYNVFAYDQRGHGRSGGMRSYIHSMDELICDLRVIIAQIRQQEAELPLYVFGHSMGTQVVLSYVLESQDEVQGAIVSAPVIIAGEDVTPLLGMAIRVISRLAPRFRTVALSGGSVSRDPREVQKYNEDPLNYRGRIPARTGAELIQTMDRIQARMHRIKLPILILHGTADSLVSVSSSQLLYETITSADKTIRLFDGLYHEILNEPEREEVMGEIVAWLDARAIQGTSL